MRIDIKKILHNDVVKMTIKIAIVVLIATSLLLNLFNLAIPAVKYYGTSMSPTLEDGQILLVNKLSKVEKGDVIAFYYNDKVLVRRVIAAGNEQINIDIFGIVEVNGLELEEPYTANRTLGQCNIEFPYNIPSKTFFVMGDNREVSMDSRLEEMGAVSEERVIGKVVFSLKPIKLVK